MAAAMSQGRKRTDGLNHGFFVAARTGRICYTYKRYYTKTAIRMVTSFLSYWASSVCMFGLLAELYGPRFDKWGLGVFRVFQ